MRATTDFSRFAALLAASVSLACFASLAEAQDVVVNESADVEVEEAATEALRQGTLLKRSPFIHQGWQPPRPRVAPPRPDRDKLEAQRALNEYEFKGWAIRDGEIRFSVYNKREKRGFWVKEGERKDHLGFEVTKWDTDSKQITLSVGGVSEELALAKPTYKSMPVTAAPTNAVSGGRGQAAIAANGQPTINRANIGNRGSQTSRREATSNNNNSSRGSEQARGNQGGGNDRGRRAGRSGNSSQRRTIPVPNRPRNSTDEPSGGPDPTAEAIKVELRSGDLR